MLIVNKYKTTKYNRIMKLVRERVEGEACLGLNVKYKCLYL